MLDQLLYESSSSDSDDISFTSEISWSSETSDSELEDVLYYYLNFPERVPRPKVNNYLAVVQEYTDEEFQRNFRMSRTTCDSLIQDFTDSTFFPKNHDHGGLLPRSAEEHILSFLWYAGNKSVIRSVSSRFGMAESTFHDIMQRVMNYLCDISSTVIKFPSTQEEITKSNEEWDQLSGFPGIKGAIDGTYIDIRTPAGRLPSAYINRKLHTSITLQAICDYDKSFMDVFTGVSSKMHDANVYRRSFVFSKLPKLCARNEHFIGDCAYPISEWMMTPYRQSDELTAAETHFNETLSKSRVIIENAFGLLKQRFRQLVRLDFHGVDTMAKFVVSCCVLHNLCIHAKDPYNETLLEMVRDELGNVVTEDEHLVEQNGRRAGQTPAEERREKLLGGIKRDDLRDRLFQNNF